MLNGLSGSLLSHYFAERILSGAYAGALGESSVAVAFRQFRRFWHERASQLGATSSRRTIREQGIVPLMQMLGFHVADDAVVTVGGRRVALLVGLWGDGLDMMWRAAVRTGLAVSSEWCICCNGHQLRVVDARRTYSRAYLQFDFERVAEDERLFGVFWGVMRAEAFETTAESSLILRVIESSARHGAGVGRALRTGVIDAVGDLLSGLLAGTLRRRVPTGADLDAAFDESLTLVYRTLFLMFAEARGLVPVWHPIYRNHYTIESLRDAAASPGDASGLWDALQAISRLAHRGCHAGTLVVPAFNGRLFSPGRAPLAERCSMPSDVARRAIVSLSTAHHARIDYRDLGVEQLGAIYETVLEYEPAIEHPRSSKRRVLIQQTSGERKSTGSFYTPQSITDYLVRRTLHPLVEHAGPDEILRLRVVDPAMGSAAFLVAACRFLGHAYERALVRNGECEAAHIDDRDRAAFRRLVAQRCLFGVDLNPTAVQLARLSLWLATLAADKPLSFLDHHLVCGNSLLGASPADLARQGPPRAGSRALQRKNAETPLFSEIELETSLAEAISERAWIAHTPDDTAEVVREKERRLSRLDAGARWNTVADIWCGCWMWPTGSVSPDAGLFTALRDQLLKNVNTLPRHIADPLFQTARAVAEAKRFLHWPLKFPEAFAAADGRPLPNPGFDAVIGNPPWHMLRSNAGEKLFFTGAGIFKTIGAGRLNLYQLFLERAMMLVKRGGRIGMVLPSGFGTDHTSSALRRRMLDQFRMDALAGFENRRAIFPIHRSVRFLLLTATRGASTEAIKCKFGIDDAAVLDQMPDSDTDGDPAPYPIVLTRALIDKLSPARLTIPDLRTSRDVAIVERIVQRFPRLGDTGGFNARFGRELNATDDREHFSSGGRGLPVLEGKHIEPFIVHVDQSTVRITERSAAKLIEPALSFARPRLAYRDVASATNRLSLIAAILPRGVLTTHSLFCLKTSLNDSEQHYLCGMLNSYVANYLVRQVMTTHLGSTTVEDLRIPAADAGRFADIVSLARTLASATSIDHASADLQAAVAHAYELSGEDFRHILSTFPLVPEPDRSAAFDAFSRLETCASA